MPKETAHSRRIQSGDDRSLFFVYARDCSLKTSAVHGTWKGRTENNFYVDVVLIEIWGAKEGYEYILSGTIRFQGLDREFELPEFTIVYNPDTDRPYCKDLWTLEEGSVFDRFG